MKTFARGDRALVVWGEKRWNVRLDRDAFSTHLGNMDLAGVVGKPDGYSFVFAGKRVWFFMPTLEQAMVGVKRQTQIIYPKDTGAMLVFSGLDDADRVIETGTGSGSFLLALLSYARRGRVVTIEGRPEFQEIAKKNVAARFGEIPRRVRFVLGDAYDETLRLGVKKGWADRIFLDLPEPWQALHLTKYLRSGGILTVYSPQITQIQRTAVALEPLPFADTEVYEVLKREWLVDAQRTRPADIMRAHTAFLLHTRKYTP